MMLMLTLLVSSSLYIVSCNKVFIGVKSKKNYDAAKAACSNIKIESGQLATWNNQNEYDQISSAANQIESNVVWIGLDDINAEGKWRFIDGDTSYCDDFDGSDCDNIPQWLEGEPNDFLSGEDCAELKYYTSGNRLNDQSCTDVIPYVCEVTINENVTSFSIANDNSNYNYFSPDSKPNGNGNYYYTVFEFSSFWSMITIISIILNVVLIACICYSSVQSIGNKSSYSTVKMYSTEDEKL